MDKPDIDNGLLFVTTTTTTTTATRYCFFFFFSFNKSSVTLKLNRKKEEGCAHYSTVVINMQRRISLAIFVVADDAVFIIFPIFSFSVFFFFLIRLCGMTQVSSCAA